MDKLVKYVVGVIFLLGCSSSQLVENWKNPEFDSFEAQKVLVIGITTEIDNRIFFEEKLTSELNNNDVNAIKSYEFFEKHYTKFPKTEEELMRLESQLLEQGFDAILLSKVLGVEEKVTVLSATRNLDRTFSSFRDDYYYYQKIYHDDDYYQKYKVFHAESSLYCICPDKERELIWKGAIDITEPDHLKKTVNDYVKVLMWALKEQQLLIVEKEKNENTNI
ncbi:hypothetical protein [Aquimarina pacifica]|uniref:hypothetical protein n=1 Tax=Aquimarina pacifica TaxID=1296415 RepID=UPI0004700C0E|nr:hypothetical protein [Aquimarina pacifica]